MYSFSMNLKKPKEHELNLQFYNMTQSDLEDFRQAFIIYKNTVSKTNNYLNFYRSFLKNSIDLYISQEYWIFWTMLTP